MERPTRVEIEHDDDAGTEGWFMMRYSVAGEFCGDTWHTLLDEAFAQVAFEYGLLRWDCAAIED